MLDGAAGGRRPAVRPLPNFWSPMACNWSSSDGGGGASAVELVGAVGGLPIGLLTVFSAAFRGEPALS
jgi:hypothetical protein